MSWPAFLMPAINCSAPTRPSARTCYQSRTNRTRRRGLAQGRGHKGEAQIRLFNQKLSFLRCFPWPALRKCWAAAEPNLIVLRVGDLLNCCSDDRPPGS
eukprot:269532-Prymnesium_polylepis.1